MKWFKRWMYRMVRDGDHLTNRIEKEAYPTPAVNRMDQLFGNCMPAIVAFKIENGYVIRSVDVSDGDYRSGTAIGTGYVYCKDHKEIAEHIVTEAAKAKMGIADHPANQSASQAMQAKGYKTR